MEKIRIAMCVEYQGTHYHGWQIQKDSQKTIQAKVEAAISSVANETITVICSGRTDAGVNAVGQIIHFETTAKRELYKWVAGCNANLPAEIRIIWACEVNNTFNARRSALWRRYIYVVANVAIRPAIGNNYVTWHRGKLCVPSMLEAAQAWLGEHDFSAFRDAECQSKTAVRDLKVFQITRLGDLIFFDIIANAFLQHMVRNMVGSLLLIGTKKRDLAWAKDILEKRDRKLAGMTAAASGLFLFEVGYSSKFRLPAGNRQWLFSYMPKMKVGEV